MSVIKIEVDVNDAQAVAALKRVQAGVVGVRPVSPEVAHSVDSFKGHVLEATGAIQKMARVMVSLQTVAVYAVAALGVGKVLEAADAWASMSARLVLATGSMERARVSQELLYRLAQEIRVPLADVVELYTRISLNTENLNATQSELLAVTRLLMQSYQLSGASVQEAAGSTRQFTQAMSRSKLAGDELVGLLENAPRVIRALGEGLKEVSPKFLELTKSGKTTIGALLDMAKTAQNVGPQLFAALLTQSEKVDREFRILPIRITEAWTKVKNVLQRSVGSIDSGSLVTSLQRIVDLFESVSGRQFFNQLAQAIATLTAGTIQLAGALATTFQKLLDSGPATNVAVSAFKSIWNSLNFLAQGFSQLPGFIQEAGLITAYLFGAKGAAALIMLSAGSTLVQQLMRSIEALKKGMPLGPLTRPEDVDAYLKKLEDDFVKAREKFRFTKEGFDPSHLLGKQQASSEDIKKQVDDAVARIQAQTALLRAQLELSEAMGEIGHEERLRKEVESLDAEDNALGKLLPSLKAGTAEHAKLATTQIQAALSADKLNAEIRTLHNNYIVSGTLLAKLKEQTIEHTSADELLAKQVSLTGGAFKDLTSDTAALYGVLERNKDLNFVQRILRPEDFNALQTGVDEFATHMMETAEVMGKFIAYPRIIFDENSQALHDIGDQALKHAMETGEFISFESAKAAERFAQNYKTVWGEFTISQAGVQRAGQKTTSMLNDTRTAMGYLGSFTVSLSEKLQELRDGYDKTNQSADQSLKIIREITSAQQSEIDALEAMKKISPLEADIRRIASYGAERTALVALKVELLKMPGVTESSLGPLNEMIQAIDVSIFKLKDTSVSLKAQFANAFEGITDILSLFGVKVGKLIIMLQQVPRALGGLEKIAGAIGGIITLSNREAVASMNWQGADGPISNVMKLGDAAGAASGDVGFFGSMLGWASRLLNIFGGGLNAFSGKIGSMLQQMGVSPGMAGMMGNIAGGGSMGFGLLNLFGGGNLASQLKSTAYGAIGNMIMPGIGGIIGSIIGVIDSKITGLITSIWGGNKGAEIGGQIGSFMGPVGTFIGGFIGSLFGSIPKGKLSAEILPFSRDAFRSDSDLAFPRGIRVGDVGVNVGGNVMKKSKELKAQEQIAQMLNELVHSVVGATVKLMGLLPARLGDELDAALSTLEQTGLEIVDKKWKGGKAGKKLKKRIKGLADEAVSDLVEALGFGDLDLKALGGGERGDAAKGFDAMASALSVMSAVLQETKADMTGYTGSLADFTKATLDYFQQFQQEGEAFADTVKRVGEQLAGILSLSQQIDTTVQAMTTDTVQAMDHLRTTLQRVRDQAIAASDALMIEVESGGSPEAVMAAAESAIQAVTNAMNAQIEAATELHDVVVALTTALHDGLDEFIALENQIRELGGTTMQTSTTLGVIIDTFYRLTEVSSKVAIATKGLLLFIAEGGNILDRLTLIYSGFNAVMRDIRAMTDPQAAIENLKELASGVSAALSASITQVQARYAALREGVQADLTSLQQQRDALSESYDTQLETLRAQAEAQRDQVQALQDQKDAIRDANDAQIDALQEQLSLVQQWRGVLTSVRAQLVDLFNLLAPTHPLTSLNEVRAQFDAARAAFAATPTATGAEEIQALGRQLVELAQLTPGYDLASGNFQSLASDIQAALRMVESFAATQPDADAIQEQIAVLEGEQAGLLASIDEQIAAAQAPLEAIEDQIAAIERDQRAALREIDAQIATAERAVTATLAALSEQEQAEITQLQQIAAMGLEQIRDELGQRLLKVRDLQAQASLALQQITGNLSFEQYIAERQAEAVVQLQAIQETLRQYLGAILSQIAPGATMPTSAVSSSQLQFATSNLKILSELAQGAGAGDLAQSLARASFSTSQGDTASVLANLQSASGIMSQLGYFQAEGSGILRTFDSMLNLVQSGSFQSAIATLNNLVAKVYAAGVTTRTSVPGFAGGLSYVPYDDFLMRAHKGERVLNAAEAADYRNGKSGGGSVTLNFAPGAIAVTTTGRESDAELERKLDRAMAAVINRGMSETSTAIKRIRR